MQLTSLRVYFNFQSNKKFFRDYFSTRLVSGGRPPTRGRFVSRSFSATSYVLRYLSWHQRHPFRYISLMELPYRSPPSSSFFSLNLVPRSHRIVADSSYFLHDLSLTIFAHVVTLSPIPSFSFVSQNCLRK